MVTLKRISEQTLRLVMVLATISKRAVKVKPILVWTPLIRFIDLLTYAKNTTYAR